MMTLNVSLLLFFLSAVSLCLVRGQTTNATCVSSYGWANNTLGQSPCLVASYLETACLNTSAFLVPALPDGSHYTGPGTAQVNLCNCNTITYSLISACADCQNRQYLNWGNWTANCAVVAIGLFPYPTPAGTSIPQWAYININSSTALYNPVEAEDGVPTVSLLTSFSTASTTTSSTSPSSAATTSTSATVSPTVTTSSGSNVGAIAGGVVGGIAFLMGAAMLALFSRVLQRRRKAHAAARFADMVNHVDTSHVGPLLKQESSTDRRGHAEHSRENSQAEEMKELVRTTSAESSRISIPSMIPYPPSDTGSLLQLSPAVQSSAFYTSLEEGDRPTRDFRPPGSAQWHHSLQRYLA